MPKFPVDAPKQKVLKALKLLGIEIVREKEHISMIRINADASKTPLTLPNHSNIKGYYIENHLYTIRHLQR